MLQSALNTCQFVHGAISAAITKVLDKEPFWSCFVNANRASTSMGSTIPETEAPGQEGHADNSTFKTIGRGACVDDVGEVCH